MIDEYILIRKDYAPEVFTKVIEAKKRLLKGKCKKVSEAIEEVDLSRSAFYKYKDNVFEYSNLDLHKIYTIFFEVADVSGVLFEILKSLADMNTSVLTINQNIPVNHIANITVSFRFLNEDRLSELIYCLKKIDGVNSVDLLSVQ